MNIVSKYYYFIKKLFEKEESGLSLSLFRIIYGLVLFADVFQIFYFSHLIFDPIPYIQEAPSLIQPMLILWLISITLIIFGLFTKPATIINYIMTVLFLGFTFTYGPISEHNYHVDKEFLPIAFLLMFMPLSRRLSLDSLINKIKYSTVQNEYLPSTNVSSINYIILIIVAGLIYMDSIFYKLSSPMWTLGLGVWLPSSLPWSTWLDLSFILNNEYLMKFLGYLTLFFQLTYIFFIWIKRLKVIYLLVGIGLHIGIILAFPIPWFGMAMVALYVGLIPYSSYNSFYERFIKKEKKPSLIFYFDQNCPLCNRVRIIVEYFDNGRNINFMSVQKESQNNSLLKEINSTELLNNVYSEDNSGTLYSGIDTYVKVLNKVWIFKPIGLLMYLPFIKFFAKKIYGYIAKHRITYGCDEESCSMPITSSIYQEKDDSRIKILQNFSFKDLKIFFVAVFLFCLVMSQIFMIQKSPLMYNIYLKLNVPSEIIHKIRSSASHYKRILYPFTGISPHAVFMDGHFRNYNHTVAIAFDDNGKNIFLPIINKKGQASFYNTGRQWVNYSFRVSNKRFNNAKYNKGIQKYIYFWAHKNNINITNSKFNVLYKYNEVPYHWEKDVLKKALDKPWKKAGILGFRNGIFYSNIINIEKQEN